MSCWHLELGSTAQLSLSALNKYHTERLQSVKLLALFTQTADMWCSQDKLPINWVNCARKWQLLLFQLSWSTSTSAPGPCLKFEWCQDWKYKIAHRSKMKNWDHLANTALWMNLEQTQDEIQSWDPLVVSTGSSLSTCDNIWAPYGTNGTCHSSGCAGNSVRNQHKIFFLDTPHKGPNCDILQAPKRGPLERLCLSIWSDYSCSPSSKQLPNTMCFSSVLIKS